MDRENLFWRMLEGKLPLPNAADLLGWSFIEYEDKHRQIEVSFNAPAALTNPLGMIQGGMITAMLDDTMGPAVYANLEQNQVALTVKLNTCFKQPAKPGPIIGVGKLVKRGRKYWYTCGMLKDTNDNILATATATFKIVRL
ncbi:PaaI family thioesterase [Pseudomonas sp. NUPR-001]|uniref:PaaI family thioesterase n=1 Tax=Pseudomonas sp. NUPR-001 TaxID=3416058 RepID=UPI003F961392